MATTAHHFKDGTTDPTAKKVPSKTMARLEEILAEARRKKASTA